MTEDREQTSGEDREQNVEDVEGHGYIGQTAGQQIGANTPEPSDQQTG